MAEDKYNGTTGGKNSNFDESKHPRDKDHLVRAVYKSQGKELPKDATALQALKELEEKDVDPSYAYKKALENNVKKEKEGKIAIDTPEAKAVYDKISKGNYYSLEELDKLPIFQEIEKEIVKARERNGKRLGVESGYTYKLATPTREKQRAEWVENFLQGKGVDTLPKTPLQKGYKMTVVVGLPASGKSTTIATPLSEEQGAFIFDSDEMKKLIDGFDGGKNADGVHDESKELLEKAQEQFINGKMKGTNLVYPIIGDNSAKTIKKLQPFIDAGYNIEIAYKKAETTESINRVLGRAIKTGRFIPKNVVMKYSNEAIEKAYNEMLKQGIKRSKYSEK